MPMRHRNNTRLSPYLWVLWCVLVPPVATVASPLEIYGFDGRSVALANAMTTRGDDYTASFYNPALATKSDKIIAGAGWMLHVPRLAVRLERAPDDPKDAPIYPSRRSGLTVGGLFPLGETFGDRLAIAFGIYAPIGAMLEGDLNAPTTPQFYRFHGRANKFVTTFGLGITATQWLSIGVGAQGLADLVGSVDIKLRLSDQRVVGKDAIVEAPFKMAPIVGVLVEPLDELRIGASWRRRIQLDFDVPSALQIDDAINLDIGLSGTALFTPDRWSFGLSYRISPARLLVNTDIVLTRWSTAPDPTLNVELNASGTLLEGLGLAERLDVAGSRPVDLNFKDTWSIRLGVEHQLMAWLALRTGYGYEPSPAPPASGAYNYLDPSHHRYALGLGFMVENPIALGQRRIHIDIAYALLDLSPTTAQKVAGSRDPVGDYEAIGRVHVCAFTLRHEL
ncbi:MAG: outer membrane protein transport protein [Myxococcota bacterium]|nr:outer membrane protein transport protein [Myxococcota bacterium]